MTAELSNGFQARKTATLNRLASYQRYVRAGWSEQSNFHNEQLSTLFSFALKSPWWRERLTKAKIDSSNSFLNRLASIPVLTRSDLQQYGLWMPVWIPGSKPEHYQITRTSGSTGKPVQVTKYRYGLTRETHAIHLLDAIWQKRDMSKPFLHLRANSNDFELAEQVEPFCFVGKTGLTYGRKLTEISMQQILDLLAEKQIKNFVINPIALNILAKEQLRLSKHNISVEQILSWGDKLDQHTRDLAREAFGAKVCDRYSAEELGYIAIQCPESEHLHTLPFFNFVQILNQDNQPCKVGEMGRVVVTNLHSFGQPLIKYELGDMAAWGEPCEFGINTPVLEPLIVRIRDVEIDELGNVSIPRLDKTALTYIPAVADFQVLRFTDGIVALVRTFSELELSQLAEIKADLAAVFPGVSKIEILHGEDINWLDIWKRKLIVKIEQPIPQDCSLAAMRALLFPTVSS